MVNCNNIIRDIVLKNNYHFLFSLESDIFCPENTIEYLLNQKRQVVGLPYFTRQNYWSLVMNMKTDGFGVANITKYMTLNECFIYSDGLVNDNYMTGLGCLLIHRTILDKIKFRVNLNDEVNAHADTYFHDDLLNQLGIKVQTATKFFCHHQNSNWFKIYTGKK